MVPATCPEGWYNSWETSSSPPFPEDIPRRTTYRNYASLYVSQPPRHRTISLFFSFTCVYIFRVVGLSIHLWPPAVEGYCVYPRAQLDLKDVSQDCWMMLSRE